MMQKISIVLAVFNEEDNIAACLRSIEDLAWEIVIVDGGSVDKTVEIAKKFGAQIIMASNPIVFHINKNMAIDAAKGDWIFQLDADEAVSDELKKEIIEKTSMESDVNGYWIPRKNFFLGRFLTKGGQYPDYTLRLYRKDKGRLPAKDVHEQAVVEGGTAYMINPLLHIRDKSFTQYIERWNRYTDLLAFQLNERKSRKGFLAFVDYILIKPLVWFVIVYLRHRGYVDGFPGFVFAIFSSLRFPVSYAKFCINYENSNK